MMKNTVSKNDLTNLGYHTHTAYTIIRQAKQIMVQEGIRSTIINVWGTYHEMLLKKLLGFLLKERKKMSKTRYVGVYCDQNGKFFYPAEMGVDLVTGKRIQKKGRKDKYGRFFTSAREAYKELSRIKNDYLHENGFSNYTLNYTQFLEKIYLPYYKANVEQC